MEPNNEILCFSNTDLKLLKSVVGQKWQYVIGNHLTEAPGPSPFIFAWDDMVFSAGDEVLAVHSEMVERDFEGWKEIYPILSIVAAGELANRSDRTHHRYFQYKGETIEEVYVVRNEIRRFMNDVPSWKLIADYGIVLKLDTGSMFIGKNNQRQEAMCARFANNSDDAIWDDGWFSWAGENDPGERFETKRKLIPINELIS